MPTSGTKFELGYSDGDVTKTHRALSAAFIVGYLLFQVIYPSLAWFRPTAGRFTWSMFSGSSGHPTITAVFPDGSTRTLDDLLVPSSPVRVLSAAVDRWRVVPPYLCARWGVREVRASNAATGRAEVTECRSVVP